MSLDVCVALEAELNGPGTVTAAYACCGGGETFDLDDRQRIADAVADHVRTCLPDLMDEEFGEDGDEEEDDA